MKLIDEINKKFGSGSIFSLEDQVIENISVIPTGSFRMDEALGVGGVPLGRITEVYGPESSGKTTFCQHVIANAQLLGLSTFFVDAEHALDPYWLSVCKVNKSKLYVSQPDTGEQALDIVESILRSKERGVIIIDSVAALVPKAEIEGDMGDAHMALQARLMSQAMRKLIGLVKNSGCAVIFTNQLRDKVGVTWGNPETTTGGNALKYYASVRIEFRKGQQIKDREDIIGTKVRFTIKKNKVAPPFKAGEFDIYYESGISLENEIINYAIDLGIIEKGGAGWFTVEGEKIQGQENVRQRFVEDPVFCAIVENKVRNYLGLPEKEVENV